MRIIRGTHNFATVSPRGGAVTIGNFDGVHRGHQAVISQILRIGAAQGLAPRVVIFEPQPNEFFAREAPVARLTRLSDKLRHFAALGVEEALVLRFDDAFSRMEAENFVREVLVAGLRTKALVIGDDFHFGRGRAGDFTALRGYGAELGFSVTRADTFEIGGARVSSTRVRELLGAHALDEVAELLGRPYRIVGRVVHGNAEGRKIGFPTANIQLGRRCTPLEGIYAVRVFGAADQPVDGSAYIGTRPVIEDNTLVLEVHLFDFDGDLYGRRIEVEFVAWLRGELPMNSFEELKAQIARDNAAAREALAAKGLSA